MADMVQGLPRKVESYQLVKGPPAFMKPEDSLTCSQKCTLKPVLSQLNPA